jgi:ATP-dependent exoDNAse (exonuclease V) beta subunit
VQAVLVDEFQDTNARQRDIVYALTGFAPAPSLRALSAKQSQFQPQEIALSQKALLAMTASSAGELFIVGDAKQSIYKFRGADVSVFRQVQADIQAANGLTVDLDLTFRAHQPLVQNLNDLLRPVLGEAADLTQPYEVPFAELRAQRKQPEKQAVCAPFVEFHLGVGEDAATGREATATALAQRLHALHRAEEFAWSDMALLFRASSGFSVYEDALERAGIPFVTIAGRGFYDRPEIRDVLNALAAIHDPTDDLALAGLLRSPAIGLSDADLYRLRFANDDQPRSLWENLSVIASAEREAISSGHTETASLGSARSDAYHLIAELHDLAGRVSVAEVLKRFLDATHYRTLLSAVPQGHRLRRNVDKLLVDAHASRLISLGEFLEYVQTLEDTGVREGEAPVAAEGAVQLMTVHKAKGLEFPVVVIADAAHEMPNRASKVLLDDHLGLQIDLTDADGAHPVAYRLARLNEQAKDDAEDKRLLYVAATRAKEKLIVSGHAKISSKHMLTLSGWLRRLGEVVGLDAITIDGELTAPRRVELSQPLGCVLYPPEEVGAIRTNAETVSGSASILQPPELVVAALHLDPQSKIQNPQSKVWRVVPKAQRPVGPAWVVGRLTHEALRRWRFPDSDNFDAFLLPFALEAGLTDHAEIQATINEVRRMLRRFQAHPLYEEVEKADRLHKVPYALPGDTGVIDLLYRSGDGWTIVDFKTDEVRSIEEMRATIEHEKYAEQVQRYIEAIAPQIGQRPRGQLVFLRVKNEVQVEDV